MKEYQADFTLAAGIYVDGFNLYHGINKLQEPWLKWLSLWRLGERIAVREKAKLARAVFCTAIPDHVPQDARERHMRYNAALRATGVEVIQGHYIFDSDKQKYTEKQSDLNTGLELLADAEDGQIQIAILVSADSDQAATGRIFKKRHPDKRLVVAVPPGQAVPQKLQAFADSIFQISKAHIDICALPEVIQGKTSAIRRPDAYQPPSWWMHPDERPQKRAKG